MQSTTPDGRERMPDAALHSPKPARGTHPMNGASPCCEADTCDPFRMSDCGAVLVDGEIAQGVIVDTNHHG
jgi:hypothetical protein